MNRGVLQSSPVQQLMAAGSPNWWNINSNMRPAPPPPSQLISHPNFLAPPPPNNLFPQYAPPPSSSSLSWHDHIQELPESWSQLLMGGLVVEDQDKSGLNHIQHQAKKLENWEEQLLHHHQQHPNGTNSVDHVNQENSANSYHHHHHHHHQVFGSHGNNNAELIQAAAATKPSWPQMMPVSSPKSCVTSLSSNMLDFSNNKADGRHPPPDRSSSECNSTATGGAAKKARVQPSSSTQSTFKVRKEKLGDRITALHQLVSPFGKTDTASVLLEAIGYIRFLQSQIEALSLPYLGSGSGNNMRQQQSVQGERNCLFPEDPGQLLNDNNCMKRKVAPEQECNEEKDLSSRGLCLVPISCTVQVGSENGADYWAPAAIGGGFQ